MKKLIMFTFITFTFFANSQNTVYKKGGAKEKNIKESVRLKLSASDVSIKESDTSDFPVESIGIREASTGVALDVVKEIFSLGYKITSNILKARIQKFGGEYEKENSFIECGTGKLPTVQFTREIDNGKSKYNGLDFSMTPHKVDGLNYFYYTISDFKLLASKAKSTRKSSVFDYSIQLHLTYVKDTTANQITLPLIQLHSIGYGDEIVNQNNLKEFRTDLIPIPEGAYIVKVGVKIVETNPQKVDAQRFLDLWNEAPEKYKDDIQNVITLLVKEDK